MAERASQEIMGMDFFANVELDLWETTVNLITVRIYVHRFIVFMQYPFKYCSIDRTTMNHRN